MRQVGLTVDTTVRNLAKARASRAQRRSAEFEQEAIAAGMHPADAARYALNLTEPEQKREPFIMLMPAQNAAVVNWLHENSERPQMATALWAQLFCACHPETGKIMLTRAELAARIGCSPKHVSTLMTELSSINAITKTREGRRVIYSMNPNVATHMGGKRQRVAKQDAAGPLLVMMQGGAV